MHKEKLIFLALLFLSSCKAQSDQDDGDNGLAPAIPLLTTLPPTPTLEHEPVDSFSYVGDIYTTATATVTVTVDHPHIHHGHKLAAKNNASAQIVSHKEEAGRIKAQSLNASSPKVQPGDNNTGAAGNDTGSDADASIPFLTTTQSAPSLTDQPIANFTYVGDVVEATSSVAQPQKSNVVVKKQSSSKNDNEAAEPNGGFARATSLCIGSIALLLGTALLAL